MPRIPPFRAAVMVVAGLVAIALCAEAAYRWKLSRLPGRGPELRYYRHERLSRALVRGVDYDGVVHINRHGLRGPDFELTKQPGTTRVLVVGASTAFDPCARSDAETWPARLEHWLHALAPEREIDVLNAGGLPLLDQLIRLQTELWRLEPDVIVMYAGHGIVNAGDLSPETTSGSMPRAAPAVAPWDPWLRRHSRLYDRIFRQFERAPTPADVEDADWDRAIERATRDFERDLTSFALIARSLGADLVFVEINRLTGERAPATFTKAERDAWTNAFATPPEVVHAGYLRFDSIWSQVADSADMAYVPAERIAITGSAHYCANDPIHFSGAGAEAMGRRLAERLLAREVL